MMPWSGRSFGADRFLVSGSGCGSGCTRACRTVRRECPHCRAICLMDIPSRQAHRIAPWSSAVTTSSSPLVGESIHEGTFNITNTVGVGPAYTIILPPVGSHLSDHFQAWRIKFSKRTPEPSPRHPCRDRLYIAELLHP